MADIKAILNKVKSKFDEPRGIMRKTEKGAEIVVPRAGSKPVTISGDTPEKARELYEDVYGPSKAKPELPGQKEISEETREKIRERLKKQKEQANIESPEEATEPGLSFTEKAGKVNTAIRSKVYGKLAEKLGAKAEEGDNERTAFNIVQAGAEKLGLPEDSTLVNAAKAAAVTGLEMAPMDLTDLVPAGTVGKVAKKLKGSKAVTQILSKFKK